MMAREATGEASGAAEGMERVPFPALRRAPAHRTSEPTNKAIWDETDLARQARGGPRLPADLVILAALRLAARDRDALHDEIRQVSQEMFFQHVRPQRKARAPKDSR